MEERVGLGRVWVVLFSVGATTFGGMWAATRKLEEDLVARTGWLSSEELQELFVVSTLIPAPKFLSLSGLIGYRVRGWWGAVVAVTALITPASAMVVAAVVAIRPALLTGALEPLGRAIAVAVVGLLFGNAVHQLRRPTVGPVERVAGYGLALASFTAIVLGVPLVVVAAVGFVLGALLIRGRVAVGDT